MKVLSTMSTTASALLEDENADDYPVLVDGGRQIFARQTDPSPGVTVNNGDFWFQLP